MTFPTLGRPPTASPPNSTATVNGPLGNPDGDLLPNLLEYAFNSNPQASNPSPVLASAQNNPSDGLNYLVISYPQLIGTLELAYTVELSADLANWSSSGSQLQQISVTTDPGGVTQTLTLRIKPAISPGTRQFARVRVTSH